MKLRIACVVIGFLLVLSLVPLTFAQTSSKTPSAYLAWSASAARLKTSTAVP